MDKQPKINKKPPIILPNYAQIIVFIVLFMWFMAVLVILLSPYFGKTFFLPIVPVNCQVAVPLSIELCYKADDILALNKALNLSDSLSLFGILLAIFAVISPVFSYFSLQKEKQVLENLIEKGKVESEKSIEKRSLILINQIPKILVSIESFKISYQNDKPKNYKRNLSIANDIAQRMLLIFDRNTSITQVFAQIENYLHDKDVIEEKKHIKALKQVLREFYDATYFGSTNRKSELKKFLENALKTSIDDFLIDTSPRE